MKKVIVVLIVLISFSPSFSQQIGCHYDDLPDHEELGVEMYKLYDKHYELVTYQDSMLIVYIFDLSNDIMLGIDYIYPTIERGRIALKTILNDAYNIGGRVYIKNNNLIFINNEQTNIRSIKYSKKFFKRAKRIARD